MAAIIKDISNPKLPLPEWLVLDASLLLVLDPSMSSSSYSYSIAKKFLQRLHIEAKKGGLYLLLPLLALEECYFKLMKIQLSQLAQKTSLDWHSYYKQNPHSIRSVYPALEKFKLILDAFPISVIEPEDLALRSKSSAKPLYERMGEFVRDFSVLPKDATILSDADRLGIHTIASLDNDWKRATGFTVYTIT